MKLVSYISNSTKNLGIFHQNNVYCISSGTSKLADNMLDFLQKGNTVMDKAKIINQEIINKTTTIEPLSIEQCTIIAPLENPTSVRDAYAFRQHVATSRKNRGVEMIPEFDQYPIFYFTNHNAIQGPYDDIVCMPDHFEKLDYELEIAIVIGKKGRNISAKDADDYIAGFMIMNDLSARLLQVEEMKLNLGPAKGKDFGTVIGPYLVTADELKNSFGTTPTNHQGKTYDLEMKCWINGNLLSEGNTKSMDWTFAEIIERCSYGTDIYPGDIIGSGTVGTGCFLELNGTGKRMSKGYKEQWLKEGDVVEMEIDNLGKTKNIIKKCDSDFSILELKKNV